ncbi:hypothetical protein D9757_005760 [Collybiopsis confluens]|uniref:VPS9 domain-containing protein n=1 Tax=Collybiopsis confluens TaxID=2823264 RepID=A0A8H5MAY8_9AGAR|nr:hypothetical protein D9757_005760 [Collybiopsis confluens]
MPNPSSPSRESFPAASIGRSAGSKLLNLQNQPQSLSRQSSHESLNVIAHPLLSPSSTTTSLSTSSGATTWDNGLSSNNLGYVPYTRASARHKPAPASPTHSTSSHVPHPSGTISPSVIVTPATTTTTTSSASHIDLTTKLQLMNLKAVSASLGIETGTVGWAILEALAKEHGSDWDLIWDALDKGKVILLLPSEQLATLKARSNTTAVSPAFVKNHVFYAEFDEKTTGRVISLSGLRGILQEERGHTSITFTSTLHPDTQIFRDISSPATRSKGFASLMPFFPSSSDYTSSTLSAKTQALSLPPRGSTSVPPPLPPRRNQQPGSHRSSMNTADSKGGAATASGRFAGLASLFGRSHPTSSALTTNPNPPSPAGSRPPSIILSDAASEEVSIEDHASDNTTPVSSSSFSISVLVYVVSASIIEQDVLGGIWKGVVADVESILRYSALSIPETASASEIALPPNLPGLLVSFLESANALSILRTSAPHPRISSIGSKAMTRRLISGSGSTHREVSRERRERKEVMATEFEHQSGLDVSSSLSHSAHDLEHYVYEINPYGVQEGWGSAAGSESSPATKDRHEAESGAMEAVEDLGARWQALYREIEDVVEEWADTSEDAEAGGSPGDESNQTEHKVSAVEKKEQRKREIFERAERALCLAGGFYERLFPTPSCSTTWTTDSSLTAPAADEENASEPTEIITDPAHDDALASRIAALVMVDFGLRDLDVDIETGADQDQDKLRRKEEVMAVLRVCGNELCGLENTFTPKEKADTMVRAHRMLVDGLSKLSFTISLSEPGSSPKSEYVSDPKADEEDLKTAVPWKKDVAFPQVLDDDIVDTPASVPGEPIQGTSEPSVQEQDGTEGPNRKPSADTKPQASSFSLDTLFPLLILTVIVSNPPRLISHLLFTQRFLFTHHIATPSRSSSSTTGEQTYCLVNLMAVAEFIGSLDLEAVVNARSARGNLVLTEDGPMPMPVPMSLPITIGSRVGSRRASVSSQHSAVSKGGSAPTTPILSSSFTLRTRVEQQASALSSSANKVLSGMSGVMDSSIGGFGGLFKSMNVNLSLPGSLPTGLGFGAEGFPGLVTPALSSAQAAAPWNNPYLNNPRNAMERKESGFSIKSLKLPTMPSIPNIPTIPNLTRAGPGDSKEKEMVSVSRPGSVRSVHSRKPGASSLFGGESTEEDEESEDADEEQESYEEGDEDSMISGEENESDASETRGTGDARSIKSFESMMSDGKRKTRKTSTHKSPKLSKQKDQKKSDTVTAAAGTARKSLSDRLARVSSGISGSSKVIASPPASRRSSLLVAGPATKSVRTDTSRPQTPTDGLHGSQAALSIAATLPVISKFELPPLNDRFLSCTSAEDLRLGDVRELLREYQALAQAVKAIGGFAINTLDSTDEIFLDNS